MKIAVYTIALNEIQHVDRWYESVKNADYLIVADTGSTDGTPEALRAKGVSVFDIKIKPWRFDDARNVALSLVPQDADICISMDMDEFMGPNYREELEKSWLPGTTRLSYVYVHDFDDMDQPRTSFLADKIHNRFGYRWKRPIHETIFALGDEQTVSAPSVIMNHKQDAGKKRGQYLHLLAQAVEENPRDSQLAYWLGREQSWSGDRESAVATFKKYLAMPESGWDDERSEAMKFLADLLPNERLKWLRLSAAEAPHRRETWYNLAAYYYDHSDWPNLYAAASEGLKIVTRKNNYLEYPHAWGAKLPDFCGLACWNLGLKDQSLRMFEQAHNLEPHDERVKNNYLFVKSAFNQ